MENRVVATLLTLMDGMESDQRVIVIAATNRYVTWSIITFYMVCFKSVLCFCKGPIRWTQHYGELDALTEKLR